MAKRLKKCRLPIPKNLAYAALLYSIQNCGTPQGRHRVRLGLNKLASVTELPRRK